MFLLFCILGVLIIFSLYKQIGIIISLFQFKCVYAPLVEKYHQFKMMALP